MDRRFSYAILCFTVFSSLFMLIACMQKSEPVKNLALGKMPVASYLADFTAVMRVSSANNTNTWEVLTDGVYGDRNGWSYSPTWLKIEGNFGRELIIDLGQVDTVNSISLGFGQKNDAKIAPPPYVKYYVSNDGNNYTYIGRALPDVPLFIKYTGGGIDRKTYKLDKLSDGTQMNIKARYVKMVFYVDTLCYADEIEIMGNSGVVNNTFVPIPAEDNTTEAVNKYPGKFAEGSAGIGDQFLLYTGPYRDPEITNWTEEKIRDILGYKDNDGYIKDWFFDNLLVLPVSSEINPSGTGVFATKADWETFLNFIFKQETQLGAVNSMAEELNQKLGTGRKVKIGMAIPVPTDDTADFGDINGDGSKVSFRPDDFESQVGDPNSIEGQTRMFYLAMDNRIKAVKWYVNEVERRFKAAGYDNLELTSYYLYNESLNPIKAEEQWAKAAGDYIKSKGYCYTWIPHPGTLSPIMWKEIGFTTASFQPNYAFGGKDRGVIPAAASFAKKYGLGIEMEYGWGDSNPVLVRKFAEYLNNGVFLSYMKDSYHNYYLNATSLIDAGNSEDPVLRALYDRIYEFTKEVYVPRFVLEGLAPDITDKSDITVPVKILNASNFVNGSVIVLYDASKIIYKNSEIGDQLDGIGGCSADIIAPGVIKVGFKVDDRQNALYGDMNDPGDETVGRAEIVRLHFSKKTGVDEQSITKKDFATYKTGVINDKDGNVYLNWSQGAPVPGYVDPIILQGVELQ